MSKAKARARAKARTMAKLANRKKKDETSDDAEPQAAKEQRPSRADAKGGPGRQFGAPSHIKSAARTTRGAARSR